MDVLVLNRLVPIIILSVGIIMFFTAYIFKYPDFLDAKEHPSTTWGFVLWLVWWSAFLVVYSMMPASVSRFPLILSILDVGDLALLGFAICYCSGDAQFSFKRLALLLIALVFFPLYYFTLYALYPNYPNEHNPTLTIWLFAPSAVLANVAVLSLGWSFLVRWGTKAVPFFLITAGYALAQLPAYLALFVVMPKEYENFSQLLLGTEKIFLFLSIGKVILAGYPLVLFLSPEGYRPDMRNAKYWPSNDKIKLHPNIRRGLVWGLSTIVTLLLGAAIQQFVNGT